MESPPENFCVNVGIFVFILSLEVSKLDILFPCSKFEVLVNVGKDEVGKFPDVLSVWVPKLMAEGLLLMAKGDVGKFPEALMVWVLVKAECSWMGVSRLVVGEWKVRSSTW